MSKLASRSRWFWLIVLAGALVAVLGTRKGFGRVPTVGVAVVCAVIVRQAFKRKNHPTNHAPHPNPAPHPAPQAFENRRHEFPPSFPHRMYPPPREGRALRYSMLLAVSVMFGSMFFALTGMHSMRQPPPRPAAAPAIEYTPAFPLEPTSPTYSEPRQRTASEAFNDFLARLRTYQERKKTSGVQARKPTPRPSPRPRPEIRPAPPPAALSMAALPFPRDLIQVESSPFENDADAWDDVKDQTVQLVRGAVDGSIDAAHVDAWTPPWEWIEDQLVKSRRVVESKGENGTRQYQVKLDLALGPREKQAVAEEFRADRGARRTLQTAQAYVGTILILGGLAVVTRLGTGRKRP